MPRYKYLIVGGGMAADAAVKAIREIDQSGTIGVIGCESSPPYKRPPLTKGLWKGKPVESIWLHTDQKGAILQLGRHAQSLDAAEKRVTDDRGTDYTFDKLLIATGGTPRTLPTLSPRTIYYRRFDDYRALLDLAHRGDRFAVIGGGFVGTEIAAALAMSGRKVTLIFPEESITRRIYPSDLSMFLNDYYRQQGVEVLAGESVASSEDRGSKTVIRLNSGREFEVDGVVAGIGITPNIGLAESAALEIGDGIAVDETLGTSHPDIYAAGDVASFYNPHLRSRLRFEHEDNALTMGAYAGRAMAGQGEAYFHLPYFYSDLFDLGYEAVGDLDSRLETVADWKEQFKEGVVYYLRDGRVRGVLLWNVWDKVPEARALIAEPGPFTESDLMGRISL